MGLAYQNGLGVTPDGREAMRWYDLAAEQGNHAALYNLGHIWVLDFKQTSDANADAAWFKIQAENGDAPAQWIMGLCAEYGSGGAHKDPTEAVRYYRMGAEQGFGPAICNLADKYENGVGVQQDLAEALRLYLQAADKRVTAAFLSLGNMYKEGRGVPQDTVQATYWLKKAADDGWEAAKAALREIQGPENG
jgi:TPR repeat protein